MGIGGNGGDVGHSGDIDGSAEVSETTEVSEPGMRSSEEMEIGNYELEHQEYGKELEQILENAATAIIFECESLDYISSSGLRVFLLAQKKISSRGASLEIHHLKPEIREVFRITGFTSIFNIK